MEYIIQLNYYNYLDYNDYIKLLETTKRFYYNKDYNHDLIYTHVHTFVTWCGHFQMFCEVLQ